METTKRWVSMNSKNGALPWIVFKRDWETTTKANFPSIELKIMKTIHPLLYLLSGRLSWPQLLPSQLAKCFRPF